MKTAKLFVDGRLVDVKTFDGSYSSQSILAKACIHFGVTNENAVIHSVSDNEVMATRNNMSAHVVLEQDMPFQDVITQSHLWRDLYELHQKRNSFNSV